jgi:hypothetical protein
MSARQSQEDHPPFAQLQEEARQEWIEALDPKTVRWLAVLPEWTGTLAEDCGFPAGGEGVEATVEDASAAMLCEVVRRSDLAGGETVRFWMPRPMRSWLFEQWLRSADLHLEDDVGEIATRILRVHREEKSVSTAILRWAELADAELKGNVVTGEPLSDRIQQSLGVGDLTRAGDWLFAAEWLSKPLGAAMELAAQRARRQLSLHHLRDQDADYLERFLPRRDQLDELQTLARPSDEWGVHFVGLSGVGKTMLMRFVSRRNEANPFQSSSRVDFDYLDPRIPLERPARLLQEFGEGFAVNLGTGERESLFKSFLEAVRTAEGAREAMGSQAFGLAAGTRQFHQAVTAFARFLEALPQPVALVLDTCEELAKLHPPGGRMWSVDATLDILEQLHAAMPELKLIVAGRRWVTSKYGNLPRREGPAPEGVLISPAREFLRFHEARGFTENEVRSYLRKVRGLDLGEELIGSILAGTVDAARVPGVTEEEGEVKRYSPNDVAFCAQLLKDNQALGRRAVREGNFDAYVEERIFKRVADVSALRDVFPAAALLGRFDAAVLEPLLGADAAARRTSMERLIAEDWTHPEGGPEPDEVVLKVDPGLLPRLGAYYERIYRRRQVREETRRRLEAHLAAKLEKGPPEATVEVADAAIHLLPPEVAVVKLERAAHQVVATSSWSWAEAVSQRLLDPDRSPPLDGSLLATIWALYLTGMKHSQATIDLAPLWEGVAELALEHPDARRGELLRVRSKLAALAATPESDGFPADVAGALLDEGGRLLAKSDGKTLASALLAAAESLIDAGEENELGVPLDEIERALGRLSKQFKERRGMQAHLLALRGRLCVLAGELEAAASVFSQVVRLAPGADEETPRFADWEGPSSLAARSMLELLRFRLATEQAGERLLARCEKVAHATGPGVDSAQLLSLAIQARLARGGLLESKVRRAEAYEGQIESYRLTASAHRTAPPLFVSVARGWIACGKVKLGLKLLRERERFAVSRRTEERSTSAAALALLENFRRLRLREGISLASHLIAVNEEQRTEALAASALIAGIQPTLRPGNEDDHAAWRARNLLAPAGPEMLRSTNLSGVIYEGRHQYELLHRLLDQLESELVRRRWEGRRVESHAGGELREILTIAAMEDPPPTSLTDPLGRQEMRLKVRLKALIDLPAVDGPRAQLGQIALEEGELLALRLPEQGKRLLELASGCFVEAGDAFGAFVAELRLAIAEIHAGGRREDARQRHEAILWHYEALRAQRVSLPTLGALTERETQELIEADDPLRGWVWRLAFYLQWYGGKGGGSRARATAMEFGPEFALRPAAGAARPSLTLRSEAGRKRVAAWSPGLYRWLPLLAAAAVLLTLGFGVAFLLGLGLVGTLLFMSVTTLGTLGTPLLIEAVGPRLPRRILPLSGLDLSLISLTRLGQGPALQAFGLVDVRPRARQLLLRIYLYRLRKWRLFTYSMIPIGGNLEGASSLPDDVHQALRRPLFGAHVPLRLEVASDFAWAPWERIVLSGQITRPGWNPDQSPRITRMRPLGFPSPRSTWRGDVAAVCVPRWRQFVESSSGREVRWLPELSTPEPLSSGAIAVEPDKESASRAVIALGAAVETKAGWRLRLDEDSLSEPLQDPSEPRMQQLLGPDLLARRFPLVVLVGAPGGESLAANKQSSDNLRGLANEVFLAGAHGVITLPVLPPAVSAMAIELLVQKFETWSSLPSEDELGRCVQSIRSRVYELTSSTYDEVGRLPRADLALDVCLFAPRPTKG